MWHKAPSKEVPLSEESTLLSVQRCSTVRQSFFRQRKTVHQYLFCQIRPHLDHGTASNNDRKTEPSRERYGFFEKKAARTLTTAKTAA